jgi:hypothetical protein
VCKNLEETESTPVLYNVASDEVMKYMEAFQYPRSVIAMHTSVYVYIPWHTILGLI